MRQRGPLFALLPIALVASVTCNPRHASPPTLGSLAGEAARIGSVAIPIMLVAAVARSRGVGARQALDGLVEDALLADAQEAADSGNSGIAWASATALARFVSERLGAEARARGEPSDDELATLLVVQAVVRRSAKVPATRARATADAILRAVRAAFDEVTFEALAKQVPHLELPVIVDRPPAFDVAGRTAEGTLVDPAFVAASFALGMPGQTSEVVETSFGWHVIRLVQRVAPAAATLESRRRELEHAAAETRVRADIGVLLSAERRRVAVEISGAADDLMAGAAASVP